MNMRLFQRLLIVVALSTITACNSDPMQFSKLSKFEETPSMPSAPPPMQSEEVSSGAGFAEIQDAGRKIIKSVGLTIEVQEVEKTTDKVKNIVANLEGFIADSHSSEDDVGKKSVTLSLRIPAIKLDEAIQALKALGHVQEEHVRGEDVTEQYFDLETRLANAKRLEARILDLLDKQTKDLKDMLEAEKELARVRESIETMEGRKRFLDSHISLSSIEIALVAPPGWGRGMFDPLTGSLQRALESFTFSLAWLIIFIFAAAPWVALLILASWLVLRFLRWRIRKKREAKAKKDEIKV